MRIAGFRDLPVALVTVLALTVAGAIGLTAWTLVASGTAEGGTASVVLPPTLLGQPQVADSFGTQEGWAENMRDGVGDAPFAGAMYRIAGGGVQTVVAARADLTGRQDLHLAADAGRPYGAAGTRCTGRIRFEEGSAAAEGRHLLCWRTSARLSVSLLWIGPPDGTDPSTAAGAVDEVWDAVG